MSASVLLTGLEVEGWDDEDIAAFNERVAANDARRRAQRNAQNRATRRRQSSRVETRRLQATEDCIRSELHRLSVALLAHWLSWEKTRYWAAENDRRYKRDRRKDERRIKRAFAWYDNGHLERLRHHRGNLDFHETVSGSAMEFSDPTFDAVCGRLDNESEVESRELAFLNQRPVDDRIVFTGHNLCDGKKWFRSRRDAERGMERARRGWASTGRDLRPTAVYRCPEQGCGGFHFTSQIRANKEAVVKPWITLGDGNQHAAGNGLTGRMASQHRGRVERSLVATNGAGGRRPASKPKEKR